MRRTFLAMISFGLAVVTLVGLKSATVAKTLGWSDESSVGPDGLPVGDDGSGAVPPLDLPGVTPGTSASPAPGATSTGGPGSVGPSTTAAEPTSGGGSGSSTAPPPPPPPPGVSGTFTGTAVAVRTAQSPTTKSGTCKDCASYSMAVTITVSNGRITATSVAYNPSPGESQTYASRANNQLKSSVLSAQTWKLGRVSGATYSGNAWELSVKDAMTKAGLPV